jgi:hypothetical protein
MQLLARNILDLALRTFAMQADGESVLVPSFAKWPDVPLLFIVDDPGAVPDKP